MQLAWYGILAFISRGAIVVTILLVSPLLSGAELGRVGLCLAAITISSQVFGYPAYMAALKVGASSTGENQAGGFFRNTLQFALLIAFSSLCLVWISFEADLSPDSSDLLALTCGIASLGVLLQCATGSLQSIGEAEAVAKVTGPCILGGAILAVLGAAFWGELGFLGGFLAGSAAAVACSLILLFRHRGRSASFWGVEGSMRPFLEFLISGLAASAVFFALTKGIFRSGGPSAMAEFTIGVQLRGLLVFGAGVYGARLIAAYTESLLDAPGSVVRKAVLGDMWHVLLIALLAAFVICWAAVALDARRLIEHVNLHIVMPLCIAGVLFSLLTPVARLITVRSFELTNAAIATVVACVTVVSQQVMGQDAVTAAWLLAGSSLLSLILSVSVLPRLLAEEE